MARNNSNGNTADALSFEATLWSAAEKLKGNIRLMIDRMIANIYESRALAELRDTLLPKPLSGELRVPAAEKLVEVNA